MKVLLVGSYPVGAPWSMNRICGMLLRGLKEEGIEVEVIYPAPVIGTLNKWFQYVDKFIFFRGPFRWKLKERDGWIVHILDQGNGIYAGWAPKCIVTCHDLLAIRSARGEFPAHRTGWSGRIYQRLILRGLRKAGAIAAVSGATRSDVERLIGPCEVIANGLEDQWRPMDHAAASVAMKQAPEPGYLLHVGGDPWYKNRGQVLKTFIDIRKTTSRTPALVLVGPPLAPAQVQALRRAGLADEVTVFTDISHESLCALYSMAGALLFPSVAEGFGWPILEAQACGCPVVTTNAEPMRETSGGAAIFADEGGWEAAVTRVLEMNGAERAALVTAGMENARKYSVKRMAREYIEFYRRHAD